MSDLELYFDDNFIVILTEEISEEAIFYYENYPN